MKLDVLTKILPSCRVVMASLSWLYSLSPMSLVALTLNRYDVKGFSLREDRGTNTFILMRDYCASDPTTLQRVTYIKKTFLHGDR